MTRTPIRFERERTYPLPVGEAWRLLSDTDRLNRNVGLPRVHFSPPDPADGAFVRRARARVYGIVPARWREYPFDWVRERRYAVRREFEWGPLAVVEGGAELRPANGGTRVRVFADITPNGVAGRLAARVVGPRNVAEVLAYCDRYLAERESRDGGALPAAKGEPDVDRARLDRVLARLDDAGSDPALVERLRRFVLEAGDADVVRARPYALARAWGADRLAVLRLFLHATRAGVFDLRWELMCPTCRVVKGEAERLADVPERFHCDTCGIDWDADLDRRVEVCFSVHPSVRRAEDVVYCIGGPFRTPHVVAQQVLSPGEARTLELPVDGALQLRVVGAGRAGFAEGEARVAGVVARRDGRSLRLANERDLSAVAVVEREEWDPDAATAAEVTALQDFRDLFSSEVLAPGQELAVRSIALLFTDLKGSTSLYEGVGDAPAYGRVSRHFELLRETVAAHGGGIVKTIGDAVMAAFPRAEDALRAALTVQRDLAGWCRDARIDPPFVLRIGVHAGPAIAVTANGRLDYFGRTVNLAARVGRESVGGDVVLVRPVWEEARGAAEGFAVEAEEFSAALRGVADEAQLVRLRVRGRGRSTGEEPGGNGEDGAPSH